MDPSTTPGKLRGHVRHGILLLIFVATTLNYADRNSLAIAGPVIARDFHLDAIAMGNLLSAFGWAYVIAQLPSGWLLDRFGSRKVYIISMLLWAACTSLQGGVWMLGAVAGVSALFALRFLVGIAEAPCFPANSRIVAAWFPARERGTASAVFNAGQYFSIVIFAPVMGWIVHRFGWHWMFLAVGVAVVAMAGVFSKLLYPPRQHPWTTPAELALIETGGGLVSMDQGAARKGPSSWRYLGQLLSNRMLIGIYLGQFGLNAVTYFFVTWFPLYLVQVRGMSIMKAGFVAVIPAICGFSGGILGGVVSDRLLRRGFSLTFARKAPLVIGMLLAMTMICCNYLEKEWLVIGFMALAYFGKGFGALGWAVVADTSPREAVGLANGLFNFIGSIAAITTPILIGHIVKGTGSFRWALVFVGANALLALLSYLVIVGEIKRVELRPVS